MKKLSKVELINKLSKLMSAGEYNLLTSQIQELAQIDSSKKFANKLDIMA